MRAGDVVKHRPTGETWVLACADDKRGEVMPCGWPETIAKADDCEPVKAATDAEHRDMLEKWSRMTDAGHRGALCRAQLYLLNQGYIGMGDLT